jgi:hypothetical protein
MVISEQFAGYDQQDSQELIACVLDAIHEDTNRGTWSCFWSGMPERYESTPGNMILQIWILHIVLDPVTVRRPLIEHRPLYPRTCHHPIEHNNNHDRLSDAGA